jgi:hypothetical protein
MSQRKPEPAFAPEVPAPTVLEAIGEDIEVELDGDGGVRRASGVVSAPALGALATTLLFLGHSLIDGFSLGDLIVPAGFTWR